MNVFSCKICVYDEIEDTEYCSSGTLRVVPKVGDYIRLSTDLTVRVTKVIHTLGCVDNVNERNDLEIHACGHVLKI